MPIQLQSRGNYNIFQLIKIDLLKIEYIFHLNKINQYWKYFKNSVNNF